MKDYIERRAMEIAEYIISTESTVRQTAKKFGVSKSTVHIVVRKKNEKYSFKSLLQSIQQCSDFNVFNPLMVTNKQDGVVNYL